MGEQALGNAGYTITGSGGGGSDGQYVFASLTELDDIIAQWTTIRDALQLDRDALWQAQQHFRPPADDDPSRLQCARMITSLDHALSHSEAMWSYTNSYIVKLTAARERYLSDDEMSAAQLRGVDVD